MKHALPLTQPSYHRTLLLRRTAAVALIIVAIAYHFASTANNDIAVVTLRADVAAGHTIQEEDITLTPYPAHLVPDNAITELGEATGKTMAVTHSKGSPLTALNIASPQLLQSIVTNITPTDGSEAFNMVPIKLADPTLANLLTHGDHVSVIATNRDDNTKEVIAAGGTIVFATKTSSDNDNASPGTIMLALPQHLAEDVAARSLTTPLTVVVTNNGNH